MEWNNIRLIADQYVSGKDATELAACDLNKMVEENRRRRKAEELSMMLRTSRGKVLRSLGYGVVEKIDGCEKILRDICSLIDLDANIVIKEAAEKKERLEDLLDDMGDIMKEAVDSEKMNAMASVNDGINMIAAIKIRKSLPEGTAQEINGNKVVFFNKKQIVPCEIQDAVNHRYNRGKAVEIRFVGEEGYEEGKSIIIDGDTINAILHSVKVEYGLEKEVRVEKQEEVKMEVKEIKTEEIKNVTVETEQNIKEEVEMKTLKIYIATMGGQYPYDAARDEELVKTLVSFRLTGEDWNKQKAYHFEIVEGGNKEMKLADEAAGIECFAFSMRTYYKCRGFDAGKAAAAEIDPAEYIVDVDAAAQVEIDTIAHIIAMENGRRVAEIAAIDHYIVSAEAQEVATATEEENSMNDKMNEAYNDNGCVVTRKDLIGYYTRSGYELPKNYMEISVKDLYWNYVALEDQAEMAAEYNMDVYGCENPTPAMIANEEIFECYVSGDLSGFNGSYDELAATVSVPAQKMKAATKAEKKTKKNSTAKSVMIAAHQLRKIVAPEMEKNSLMYGEIMSICLQVAWAKAKGKDVKKEFPWFMAVLTNVIVAQKIAQNDKSVIAKAKAAQEAAKVNAEKRRAEAEKTEKKAQAAEASKDAAAKKDEARKRKALNELRHSVAQVVLGAYEPDFIKAAKADKHSDPANIVRGITEELIAASAGEKAKEVIADMKSSLEEAGLTMPLGIRVVNNERQFFMMRKADGAVVGPFKFVVNNGEVELADA